PDDPWLDPWARTPPPDVLGYCRQEFGNRVGFWRVLDLLDRHRLRATAVVNVEALRLYPSIVDAVVERKWDVLGPWHVQHAVHLRLRRATRARLLPGDARHFGGAHRHTHARHGRPGPQSGTENTPDLLAEAGFLYHADWFMDDQPFPLRVRSGRLIAMPYSVEMNDVSALATDEADVFFDNAKRQFDCLYRE